jgi:hypothetical protein
MSAMAESPSFNPALQREEEPFAVTDESGEVDLALVDTLLDMTPAQRLQWHAEFAEFAARQRELRTQEYGFDPADVGTDQEAE